MANKQMKPSKSERTKSRILDASRTLFAQSGYEATTIRGIAEKAGIDPSMVIRYFGSKDALFALTVDFEMGNVAAPMSGDRTPGERGVRHFLRLWEGEEANAALPILLRTASSSTLAAEKLRMLFESQIRRLIEHLAGRPVDPERAALIASQMLGFAYCRYILQIESVANMAPDRVVALLGECVDHHLQMEGPLPQGPDAHGDQSNPPSDPVKEERS